MLVTQNTNKDQRYRERYAPDLKSAWELVFRKIEQDVSKTTKEKHKRGERFPHVIREPRQEERRRRLQQRSQPVRQRSRNRVLKKLSEDCNRYQREEDDRHLSRVSKQPIEFHKFMSLGLRGLWKTGHTIAQKISHKKAQKAHKGLLVLLDCFYLLCFL